MKPFKVVVADPPWPTKPMFIRQGDRKQAPIQPPYPLMKAEEIKAFPLPPIHDTAVLFLWRLASMQELALDVCKAWEFKPFSEIVWYKRTATGKPWFGMGTLVRGSHETCLIGIRGKFRDLKPNNLAVRSVLEAGYTGRHSGKPEQFYDIVESMYDGPFCELFARRKRPGWTCLGNEVQ